MNFQMLKNSKIKHTFQFILIKGCFFMKKNEPENEIDYEKDLLIDTNSVVSANECTGLMPTPPHDIYEAESYTEIYSVPKQAVNKKKPAAKQIWDTDKD